MCNTICPQQISPLPELCILLKVHLISPGQRPESCSKAVSWLEKKPHKLAILVKLLPHRLCNIWVTSLMSLQDKFFRVTLKQIISRLSSPDRCLNQSVGAFRNLHCWEGSSKSHFEQCLAAAAGLCSLLQLLAAALARAVIRFV